jgi:uncharacterized BrkB/YihY/UPF0761 family membrane protein
MRIIDDFNKEWEEDEQKPSTISFNLLGLLLAFILLIVCVIGAGLLLKVFIKLVLFGWGLI